MSASIRVEILTRAPTEFFHCQHCELAFQQIGLAPRFRADQRAATLPPDLLAEFWQLGEWIEELARRHGEQIQLTIVDVASIEGFFKALRYRARRYPTIIANGEVIYQPEKSADPRAAFPAERRLDLDRATRAIEQRLHRRWSDREGMNP